MKKSKYVFKNGDTAEIRIRSSFRSMTIVAVDSNSDLVCWGSTNGIRNDIEKIAADNAEQVAKKLLKMGIKNAEIDIRGPGMGREPAIQAIKKAGIYIKSIKDSTPIPHNGCRPPKRRPTTNH